MRKNKSKVCFVESSFGQKVRSTFPVAQYRIVSPYQNVAIVVCLRKTNTNSFILSRAYTGISTKPLMNEIKVAINRNGLLSKKITFKILNNGYDRFQ